MEHFFTNAQVVTEDGVLEGCVAVEDGKITVVREGPAPQGAPALDCGGKVLLPGCIDTHVHFREPSPNAQEDFATGTMSAAAGGITCVVEHPLDVPPVLDGISYDGKLAAIAPKAYIDYGLWGGLTEKNLGSLGELEDRGVLGYKAFLCASDPLFPMIGDGALLEAMKIIAGMGGIVGLHAENNGIITYNREHRRSGEPWLPSTHSEMRPVVAEVEAISRAILFAEDAGVRLHILHMGVWEGAQVVKAAKARGVRVTAETCPHYLALNEDLFIQHGPDAKCCPPLRDHSHAEKLWESVFDGTIDFIVSDHSPYTEEEKARGVRDMMLAPPGITGVQTGLQVMLSEGCHKRGLPLPHLARLMSTNAAKLFGIYGQKGAIREGFDADFTLVDMDREWVITRDELYYKNKNSAFVGFRGKGRPVASFVRGQCVYSLEDGFQQGPGYGKLIKRT